MRTFITTLVYALLLIVIFFVCCTDVHAHTLDLDYVKMTERVVKLEAENQWVKASLSKIDSYFTTLGLLIISGLASIAFMVFKQKTGGK